MRNSYQPTSCVFVCVALFGLVHATSSYAQKAALVLGQTADFSGPQSVAVKETTAGATAYFNKINAEGGIRGRKIELRSLDDGFDPARSVENIKTLANDKSLSAFILSRGTANAEAMLPVLLELKIPLLGPVGGSQKMHFPPNRYLFNLRTQTQTEVAKAIGQLSAQGVTRLAVVYTDDAFGNDAVQGFDKVMADRNLKPVARLSIERGSVDVTQAVDRLAATNPQATLGICIAKACAALVKTMRSKGVTSQFVSLANTSSSGYVKDLGSVGRGVIVTQLFPYPASRVSALAQELRDLAVSSKFTPSYAAMEGMIAAKVMVEALKRAGDNPTPEKIVVALESFKNYDFGGFSVNFGPGNRTGSEFVDLSIINKDGTFTR